MWLAGEVSGVWLAGEAGVRDAVSELVGGVLHGNGGVVIVDQGEDMDWFVVTGAKGVTEKVPDVGSKRGLFGDETKSLRHAIVDDVVPGAIVDDIVPGAIVPVAGKGLDIGQQIVDQLVE